MSNPIVRPVTTRADRREFLSFPWTHYRADPNWVPPLRQNQKELAGFARHPFYDDAEAQTFLAWRNGAVVGRIAAILNHAYNRYQKEHRGFFGFFESVDDQQVADALFAAARSWLAERDIVEVRGPANPSQNYELGLLIDGFDSPPTFMMTYNPPYYARLVEGAGFRKAHDLFAYYGTTETLFSLDQKLAFITEEAQRRFEIHTRPLDKRHFRRDVELFLDIYNRSAAGIWGFVPLSKSEIRHVGGMLKHLIIPELARVGEINGEPIGAVFGMPDYNPRIREIDGRLFPFGFLRLLSSKRDIRRLRMISTNVLPEYQKWGVGLVLLSGLIPKFLDLGFTIGEFSWVAESNKLSRGSLEKGGAMLEKTFRMYDYVAASERMPGAS